MAPALAADLRCVSDGKADTLPDLHSILTPACLTTLPHIAISFRIWS
jgi:hypothetical protein